jgi:YD repeat-containing protein
VTSISAERILAEKFNNNLWILSVYDEFDRLIRLSIPDGSHIEYVYDSHYLRIVSRNNLSHEYNEYDLYGNTTLQTLPDRTPLIKQYDECNRLKAQFTNYFTQGLAYDSIGNVVGQSVNNPLGNHGALYTYNGLSQLISEKEDPNTQNDHTYSYDSLYNRIVKDNNPCQFDNLNQLLFQEDTQYSYDLNGNLIRKIHNGIETTYRYDPLDRLISVTTNGTETMFTTTPSTVASLKTIYSSFITTKMRLALIKIKSKNYVCLVKGMVQRSALPSSMN